MIKKEFVPYQESVELKELGFDEPCFGYRDGENYLMIQSIPHCVISAPTFSQAFRWFREKYNIDAWVQPFTSIKSNGKMFLPDESYSFFIFKDGIWVDDKTGTALLAYSKNIIGKTKNGKKINFIGFHPSRAHWNSKVCGVENGKLLVNKKYKKPTGYTLKSFMEANPTGRFVLVVCGHALALIDGVLYGNDYECRWGLYRSIWYGFEMK